MKAKHGAGARGEHGDGTALTLGWEGWMGMALSVGTETVMGMGAGALGCRSLWEKAAAGGKPGWDHGTEADRDTLRQCRDGLLESLELSRIKNNQLQSGEGKSVRVNRALI